MNELPKRKSIRLQNYDYGSNGLYFVTICTEEIGFSIWQRSYYDEIIRDEHHFQHVWNYIEYNALKEYK